MPPLLPARFNLLFLIASLACAPSKFYAQLFADIFSYPYSNYICCLLYIDCMYTLWLVPLALHPSPAEYCRCQVVPIKLQKKGSGLCRLLALFVIEQRFTLSISMLNHIMLAFYSRHLRVILII